MEENQERRERRERRNKAIKKARNWAFVLIGFFLLAFILVIINSGSGDEASDYEAETIFKQNYIETETEEGPEETEEPFEILPAEFELMEGEFLGIGYTTWIIAIMGVILVFRLGRRGW